MSKSVLSLVAVIALSSASGCAASALPVASPADRVDPPGTVALEYEDRESTPVPLAIPVTPMPRNRTFTCRFVIPETGETFDTRSQALHAGARAGLTRFTVSERCGSDWRLVALGDR